MSALRDLPGVLDCPALDERGGCPLGGDYHASLKHTLKIYEQLCDLVKAERIEDRLTENDRDAVGASRIP